MIANLDNLIGQAVVLNTAGPMVYLGQLVAHDADGFWLEQADVHNCNEGHAKHEQYITESAIDGIGVNRKRVFVLRHTVVDLSALADVVID